MSVQQHLHGARAFDSLASTYDAQFSATALGHALRCLVWRQAERTFAQGQCILEIGCGTGEDAVHFARRGIEVMATDASAQMLAIARAKAERAGVASRVQFAQVPMQSLAQALAGRRFDGVFSNFGAINCVSRLDTLSADLAALTAPRAPLLWVVMGRHVPWEWLWFLSRASPHKAFRRLRRDGTPWRGLTVRYPTPQELGAALQPHFTPERVMSLGAALPPSYAARWMERWPRLLASLTRAERAAQRWPVLASFADHFLFTARRADAHATA